MTEPRGIVLKKTHWIWHLWLLAASLLLLSMVVFNPIFIERWISPDGHMETDGLNLLAKLRFGAFILAVMCCLFWTFRRRFSQIFLTRYDPQHWQIPDWLGFAITFGLLMLYPLLNRYPFVFPDSFEYARGGCSATLRSPTLGCAMWPVIAMTGIWGYVTVQTAITAFSFVLLSKHIFGYVRTSMVSLAILLANVGLFSGWLMADIWTIIGLISLFLIITGYTSPIVGSVLAFSLAVHYANFPVCLSVACVFWVLVRSGRKTILAFFFAF